MEYGCHDNLSVQECGQAGAVKERGVKEDLVEVVEWTQITGLRRSSMSSCLSEITLIGCTQFNFHPMFSYVSIDVSPMLPLVFQNIL